MTTRYLALVFAALGAISAFAQQEARPIFNGTDLSGWVAPENNAENKWWTVSDQTIRCQSGPGKKGSILFTEQKYRDFELTLDFRMGEGTVDSGVMLRGSHDQIQIGISGSLKRDMTCSPYIPKKGYPVEAEGIEELLKPADWNTLKVRAVGGKYVVWLNGKKVMTYASETAEEEGPIGLQLHGGKDMAIDFRNLLAKPL